MFNINKELESLWEEKEKLMEQIRPLEEKMDEIDDKIQKIKNKCPHNDYEISNVNGKDYDYTLTICKDCNEWIV